MVYEIRLFVYKSNVEKNNMVLIVYNAFVLSCISTKAPNFILHKIENIYKKYIIDDIIPGDISICEPSHSTNYDYVFYINIYLNTLSNKYQVLYKIDKCCFRELFISQFKDDLLEVL